ncbi:helix-turn-helix domain-containing protein [Sphingomonas colocasiae]|uniref:Helix-turn-helix domain-containing protein n=1 Tax=Sphingomonas colocasiae TaxID=1848973 RepID=A0ABS7PID3_9SPHN|nr:helix-turn-helix domain-containing protein [Sphingomonas colocasiae]
MINETRRQIEIDSLSESEVASLLGIAPRTLQRWHRLKKGPPRIKVGRRSLYRRSSVAEWLAKNEV